MCSPVWVLYLSGPSLGLAALGCLPEGKKEDIISIKATTTENLGFVGKEEGISAYSVVLVQKGNN